MWETILKRNIKPNATLNEVEIKIRQALKVPALEDAISVNEDKAQRLVNTSKRKERQELLQKIKQDKQTLQSYKKSNPFLAFGNKKDIQINDAGEIIDDGYGKGEFYPIYVIESGKGKTRPGMGSDSGKKLINPELPLTIEAAALHYKENIVDYDKANVNRVMPKDKPYDAPYGRKVESKDIEPSKDAKDLEEAKERLSYYENIIEDRRTSNDEAMILRLRSEIKELESQMIEDAEENTRVEFEAAQQNLTTKTTLPQIRTILRPITNADFNDFIISLDEFVDSGSSPIIDKYREKNPDKFTDIMALVESSSSSLDSSNPADRYIDKLTMMVNKKSIDFNRDENYNRVSLQVSDTKRYSRENNRLILPTNQDLSGKFNDISTWLAKHYEPLPEVGDKDLFIKKLINAINNVVDEKGGNNSIAYAIQRMLNDNLASQFSRQVVVTGRYLDSNTEQQKFRQFINTKSRKDMRLLENIATFLHRGNQMSGFLTQSQIDDANEMLQEQVGSKQFGRYFLTEIPSAQLQRKPKSNLAERFGAKGRKQTGKGELVVPEKFAGASGKPKEGPVNRPKQRTPTLYPKDTARNKKKLNYPEDYEPMTGSYSDELTENQKTVLADIRQSYKVNSPPSKKEIEERLQNLRELQSQNEPVSDEERDKLNQEFAESLGPIAMKRDGIISYEPYSARRRKFSIGGKNLEEVIAQIKLNLDNGSSPLSSFYETQVKKADLSALSTKERRKVKTMLQNAHPTEYFGEDYLRLGKVINIIDGLAEDEEAELLEKLGVKNLQMVKTAASLRKKYENLYKKLYDMVYDEEE